MKAREAYQGAIYHDVKKDHRRMDDMLKHSGGRREVPVIVEGETVTVGFGGS